MAFGNATKGYVKKHSGGGGGGGTTNYSELSNKPQINGVTLDGNKTSEDLNIGGGGGAIYSISKSVSLGYTSTETVNVDLSSLNFTDNNYVVVGYSSDYQNAWLNIELGAKTSTNQTLYIKNLGDRSISPTLTFYIIKF